MILSSESSSQIPQPLHVKCSFAFSWKQIGEKKESNHITPPFLFLTHTRNLWNGALCVNSVIFKPRPDTLKGCYLSNFLTLDEAPWRTGDLTQLLSQAVSHFLERVIWLCRVKWLACPFEYEMEWRECVECGCWKSLNNIWLLSRD